jgi:hypothetical protein
MSHHAILVNYISIKYDWPWPLQKKKKTKGCATCQMTKSNMHPNQPPLFPITPDPNAVPFSTILVDWVTKLILSDRLDSILMITDHNCSKAVVLLPCKESMTSEELAKLYAKQVFPHYMIKLFLTETLGSCQIYSITFVLCWGSVMTGQFFLFFFLYFIFLIDQVLDASVHMTHWVWFTCLLTYAYLLMAVMDRLILLTHR